MPTVVVYNGYSGGRNSWRVSLDYDIIQDLSTNISKVVFNSLIFSEPYGKVYAYNGDATFGVRVVDKNGSPLSEDVLFQKIVAVGAELGLPDSEILPLTGMSFNCQHNYDGTWNGYKMQTYFKCNSNQYGLPYYEWTDVQNVTYEDLKDEAPIKGTVSMQQLEALEVSLKVSGFRVGKYVRSWTYQYSIDNEDNYIDCGNSSPIRIRGLEELTKYRIYVRVKDNYNSVSSAASISFTTKKYIPQLEIPISFGDDIYPFKSYVNVNGVLKKLLKCYIVDNGEAIEILSYAQITKKVRIVIDPLSYIGEEGTNAEFTVVAHGDGLMYKWQVYDELNDEWLYLDNEPTYEQSTLIIQITNDRNGNMYRCIVSDKYGNEKISEPATLTIGEAPTSGIIITLEPSNIVAQLNEVVYFNVDAVGDGPLTFQWQYTHESWEDWYDVINTNINTKPKLLQFVAYANFNNQMFRCKITDNHGYVVYSRIATLTIQFEDDIQITGEPLDYRGVPVGDAAFFMVTVNGDVRSYQWQMKPQNGQWTNSTESSATSYIFEPLVTQEMDNSLVRCVITSVTGKQITTRECVLTVA